MSTIQIKYKDIPPYLQVGEFYRNLVDDNPDCIIDVPKNSFWVDGDSVTGLHEFIRLLRTAKYWMLDDIPVGIVRYCSETNILFWRHILMDHPLTDKHQTDFTAALLNAFCESKRVNYLNVISTGHWELMVRAAARMGKESDAATVAASYGNLQLLAYLRNEGFSWDCKTCQKASEFCHLDCLQYAHENGCPWDCNVYKYAAQAGHLDCMKYGHKEGLEWHVDVCMYAASMNETTCLEYAHKNGCPWDEGTVEASIRNGQWQCLVFALRNGCPCTELASYAACTTGRLDELRILHQFGALWTTDTCVKAVESRDDLVCLRFLHENGCPWNEETPRTCARLGQIKSLKFALERGCLYDNELLHAAAAGGSLKCIKYLVEDQLLLLDEKVFLCALLKGNIACIKYLLDQGCPCACGDLEYNSEFSDIAPRYTQYMPCAEFAVMRGWQPRLSFINLLQKKRFKECKELLELMTMEGWL